MISRNLRLLLLVFQRAVEQGLRIALDRGQWRAQLVRDVGDEILTHALQPFQVADVVQDGEAAAARRERAGVRPALQ